MRHYILGKALNRPQHLLVRDISYLLHEQDMICTGSLVALEFLDALLRITDDHQVAVVEIIKRDGIDVDAKELTLSAAVRLASSLLSPQ